MQQLFFVSIVRKTYKHPNTEDYSELYLEYQARRASEKNSKKENEMNQSEKDTLRFVENLRDAFRTAVPFLDGFPVLDTFLGTSHLLKFGIPSSELEELKYKFFKKLASYAPGEYFDELYATKLERLSSTDEFQLVMWIKSIANTVEKAEVPETIFKFLQGIVVSSVSFLLFVDDLANEYERKMENIQ